MIQLRTMVKVIDNTGAQIIQCFLIIGGSRKRYGRIGDVFNAAVKEAEPRRLVKKHEVVRAVLVRQKKSYKRADGTYIRFDDNAAVILTDAFNPRGTRIFGPVARELREKQFMKIISLAPEVL